MFIHANVDVAHTVTNVAQPYSTSHLSSHAVETSRPNKSHMVYYYGLSLHHKTLNCSALTQCCQSIILQLTRTENNSLTTTAWKQANLNSEEIKQSSTAVNLHLSDIDHSNHVSCWSSGHTWSENKPLITCVPPIFSLRLGFNLIFVKK